MIDLINAANRLKDFCWGSFPNDKRYECLGMVGDDIVFRCNIHRSYDLPIHWPILLMLADIGARCILASDVHPYEAYLEKLYPKK